MLNNLAKKADAKVSEAKASEAMASEVGINVSMDALILMARKTPSLVTRVAADAARTFRITEDMLPALTNLARNDGNMQTPLRDGVKLPQPS
ncbi:hypothetical protein [Cupriavidus basilensis]|uniref:hypothetical protein n=1 Tax=Cupriavidus basilensis TaxID=68895 RepID=UPI0020A6D21B|nr:hypothetical protein [Cupriavidus basilensis]MCP3025198.1 hypothetical protein [Cupriavidus basilensis]